jgi:anti-sigma factor RsiW
MSLADHDLLRLQDALDGRLTEFDRAVVEHHLLSCEACRRRSQALRWTMLRLAGAAGMAVPPTLADDLAPALTAEVTLPSERPAAAASSAPPLRGWRAWRARLFGG